MLSDEQMSNGYPFSLLNNEQMSNWVGVKHQPVKHTSSEGTLLKFNSSPLKSYRNPIGKDRLPTTIFQGRAVKLRGGMYLKDGFDMSVLGVF